MQSPEPLLITALKSVSAITNLVGDRIFVLQAPQGTTLPYLVVQHITTSTSPAAGERDAIPMPLMQIDAIAANVVDAGGLSTAIINGLDTYKSGDVRFCRFVNSFMSYDEATEHPRSVIEFRLAINRS